MLAARNVSPGVLQEGVQSLLVPHHTAHLTKGMCHEIPENVRYTTVGAQSIARAQSIAPRHSTYVIIPKRPKFRKKNLEKIKKEEFARRFFKKTVYFRV